MRSKTVDMGNKPFVTYNLHFRTIATKRLQTRLKNDPAYTFVVANTVY
jgi:hypothetical protein